MRSLSSGDRIRPGVYEVKARFTRSVLLFGAENRPLFVVDRSIGAGPLNLVVADPNGFVAADALAVPRRSPAPRFDSALPRADRARLPRILLAALPRHAPPDSLV